MRSLVLTLIIWTICFTAIATGISLTYKWYRQIGTDICIHFKDASGLVPFQSKVMHLGVDIGSVRDITLDAKTGLPVVSARINKKALKLLGRDSKFWIVRPEFTLGGINNLSAVSTGDYIAVYPVPGDFTKEFTAIDDAPVTNEYDSGLRILLKAASAAGIDIGTEVFYHGFRIGEVGEMGLDTDNKNILITLFIDPLYSKVIRKSSYFGNISGFYADLHFFSSSTIALDLRTLVKGGIQVETPNLNSPLAEDGAIFKLYSRAQLATMK